jgi:hypothetical protein
MEWKEERILKITMIKISTVKILIIAIIKKLKDQSIPPIEMNTTEENNNIWLYKTDDNKTTLRKESLVLFDKKIILKIKMDKILSMFPTQDNNYRDINMRVKDLCIQ